MQANSTPKQVQVESEDSWASNESDDAEAWDQGDDAWVDDTVDPVAGFGEFEDETVKIENQFVKADIMFRNFKQQTNDVDRQRESGPAIEAFRECIRLEQQHPFEVMDYSISSSAKIIQILCYLNESNSIADEFQNFVSFYNSESDRKIFNELQLIVSALDRLKDFTARGRMFNLVLEFVQGRNKEIVWQRYAGRFCKWYLANDDFVHAAKLLEKMHDKCRLPSGEDDLAKSDQLLSIYAIEMQIATWQNDETRLVELFKKTENLKDTQGVVVDSAAMCVVRENRGKYFGNNNTWDLAYDEFADALREGLVSGATDNADRCLVYLVLSSMMSETSVNPFGTEEGMVFKNKANVRFMGNLLDAFETGNISQFEMICAANKDRIYGDMFLSRHMDKVFERLRARVLVSLVRSYRRVRLSWLCQQLHASETDLERLLVGCILDGSVVGKVDQVHDVLDLELDAVTDGEDFYGAMEKWIGAVDKMKRDMSQRVVMTGRSAEMYDDSDLFLFNNW